MSICQSRTALLLSCCLASLPLAAHAQSSTGTGFAVTDRDVITNHHVISGCTDRPLELHRAGSSYAGYVLASDASVDLAVVRLETTASSALPKPAAVAVLRQSPALRAGEQAIAFGFPLSGALATEGNLTTGNVGALRGLRDNPKFIQITTPVQPGNSGGPLLDAGGNVIGVVAAKLNALAVMRATGDVPQNVNFAIELGHLKHFLQRHGVRANEAPTAEELRLPDIGERAKLFTFFIKCLSPGKKGSPTVAESPDHTVPDGPDPSGLGPIDFSKLRLADIRQPYLHNAPHIFEISISNLGRDRITELTIGYLRMWRKPCSSNLRDFDGFKRFAVRLAPGDSYTVRGDFSAQAERFCIVSALGLVGPRGAPESPERAACANVTLPPEKAIAACTRLIEAGKVKGRELAALHDLRGGQRLRTHDSDQAIADFNAAIRIDPKLSDAYSHRGTAHLKLGNLDRALADFEAALKLDPKSARALYGRGLTKWELRDVAGGHADMSAGRAIDNDIASEYRRYGLPRLRQ